MTPTTDTRDNSRRALSILARSLFRQMRDQGYSPEQACKKACERIVKRDPAKAKTLQVGFLALLNIFFYLDRRRLILGLVI